MFTVTASEDIKRKPDEVFAFAGEYLNDPSWRKGVTSMVYETSEHPKIGIRTRETMRSMGRNVVTIAQVTEFSPIRTAFRSVSGPVACDGYREFFASQTGTWFTYSLTLRPTGFLRLLEPLLRTMFAKQARDDVRRLKLILES